MCLKHFVYKKDKESLSYIIKHDCTIDVGLKASFDFYFLKWENRTNFVEALKLAIAYSADLNDGPKWKMMKEGESVFLCLIKHFYNYSPMSQVRRTLQAIIKHFLKCDGIYTPSQCHT